MIGTGAGLVGLGFGSAASAQAKFKLRQGYQTNMWGMPTYYMLQSGILQKSGFEVEEFAVPSGNLTMQQMVARQVDMGTYAGPSLMLGHDKGGIIAIAHIERVGKTNHVVARKDLGITKLEQLKGKKIANQTGSSTGNIFVDQVGPAHGLPKGSYQEVRMNVNDMVAALAAKTVDAMVSAEPYGSIADVDGIGNILVDFSQFDPLPVFMAATPEYIDKNGDAIVAYLKAWIEVGKDIKQNPDKVADVVHKFYTSKGYSLSASTMKRALSGVEIDVGFPDTLVPYMTAHAEVLVKENKIKAVPDFNKIFRTDFMKKAMSA